VRSRQRYSEEFKESIVQKILHRDDRSIREVCEAEGVGKSTASNWLRACGSVAGMKPLTVVKKWPAEAKLKALHDTRDLSEGDMGVYLRREGLYGQQVAEWRLDVLKSLDEARARPQAHRRDERDDRIKELERDLARMEKALAEASVRMMLEKKADAFWASREAAKR
jgi:transposase-like protein